MKWLLISIALVFGWANATAAGNILTLPGQVAELQRLQEAHQRGSSISGTVTVERLSKPASVLVAAVEANQASKPVAPPAKPTSHRAQSGDTLGKIGKQFGYDWRVLCAFNSLPDCNRITLDQEIRFPAPGAVVPRPPKAKASVLQSGEIPYAVIARAPLLNCGKKSRGEISKESWGTLNLSEEDRAYLLLHADLKRGPRKNITAAEGLVRIPTGTRIERVTFCQGGKAVARGPMRTTWNEDKIDRPVYGERFVLPSGRTVLWMWECENWVTWPTPEKPTTQMIPPKQVEEDDDIPTMVIPPKQVEEDDDIPTMVIPPKQVTAPQRCALDPKAVLGQEHGLRTSPNQDHSTFFPAGLYCTKRRGDGYEGPGVGFQGSWWHGQEVNFGSTGRYGGRSLALGSAYEWVRDKGSTTELKLLFGRMHQGFEQAQFASDRTVDFGALAVAHSDYSRRQRGEKFLPEVKGFAMVGIPTSVDASASNFGQPGEVSDDLLRKGALLQLGVHLDAYDFKYATLWFRAGYFLEQHLTETMNLRVGFSDPMRICSIGLGPNFDLKRHLKSKGWGWACDLPTAGQALVGGYRLSQVSDGKTATFDNGTVMTPLEPNEDEQPD